MSYLTILLNAEHDKARFSSGKLMPDDYLHHQASQDVRKKVAACFVLADEKKVKGYYTLSSSSIPHSQVPSAFIQKQKLPRYADLPVILLGRLAVDQQFHGQGLGAGLLLDALRRSYDTVITSVAAMAVVVDPLDDEATAFYLKYGFIKLPTCGKLFLPMKTIEQVFQK